MSLRKSSSSKNGSNSDVVPKPNARRKCTPAPSTVGLDLISRLIGRRDMTAPVSWAGDALQSCYTGTYPKTYSNDTSHGLTAAEHCHHVNDLRAALVLVLASEFRGGELPEGRVGVGLGPAL